MKYGPTLLMGLKLVACSVVIAAGLVALIYLPRSPATAVIESPSEFITIVLAAVTVVLAALAIVLAVAGAIGYVQIKNGAEAEARKTAQDVATAVAEKVAGTIAARVAEAMVSQTAGQDEATGDAFAKAEGEQNGSNA